GHGREGGEHDADRGGADEQPAPPRHSGRLRPKDRVASVCSFRPSSSAIAAPATTRATGNAATFAGLGRAGRVASLSVVTDPPPWASAPLNNPASSGVGSRPTILIGIESCANDASVWPS